MWCGPGPLRTAVAKDDAGLLAVARGARKAVVRVIWRDARFSDRTYQRNAIVVREDGLLLMAGPPARGQGTWTVRFSDGAELRARLTASDTETALSLLQVDRTRLPVLSFRREAVDKRRDRVRRPVKDTGTEQPIAKDADPSTDPKLRAHAPLLAAQAPLGLRVAMVTGDAAVAFGPIRAHERHGALRDPKTGKRVKTTGLLGVTLAALDTDAGSPLLDGKGQIVGLVIGRRETLAATQAAAAARGGLRQRPTAVEAVAVPANVAELVWPLLLRHKRVPRVALGITTKPVEAPLAEHLRIEGGHVLQRLAPAGMGERQGLRVHDVITSVGGQPIARSTTLHDALLPFEPGSRVTLGIIRGGKPLEMAIRTGER